MNEMVVDQFEGRVSAEATPTAYRYGTRLKLLQVLCILKHRQAAADKRPLTPNERGEIWNNAKKLRDDLMDTRFMYEQREAMRPDDLDMVREMLHVTHEIIERVL